MIWNARRRQVVSEQVRQLPSRLREVVSPTTASSHPSLPRAKLYRRLSSLLSLSNLKLRRKSPESFHQKEAKHPPDQDLH